MTDLDLKRIAVAMETARYNLRAQPLVRIWEVLARVAIEEYEKR